MKHAGIAKRMVGAAASSTPLRPLMTRLFRSRANIVYYHFVGETAPYYKEFSGHCSLERFEQDIAQLKLVFDFLPLPKVIELCRLGKAPKRPTIALTFDDGLDLVRAGTMEILDNHGIKATVFLITSCINNANLMWRNKLSAIRDAVEADFILATYNRISERHHLPGIDSAHDVLSASMRWPMQDKETLVDELWVQCDMPAIDEYLASHQPYMTWADIEKWMSHGHSIGLHTHTHPVCSDLDDKMIASEIIEPAAFLKQRFGLDDLPFTYPFGARLPGKVENQLIDDNVVQCAFGIRGTVPLGTPRSQLERIGVERNVAFPVFGKRLLKSIGIA